MRSNVGHVSSKQFDECVMASKLKDLSAKGMTYIEMNLDTRVIQTLKAHEVIVQIGTRYVTRRKRHIIVWAPGPKYKRHMKRWGWA